MSNLHSVGKMFMYLGAILFIMGFLLTISGRFLGLGRLPGDIYIQKGNFTFYFPVVTGIILSVVLTVIMNVFLRR